MVKRRQRGMQMQVCVTNAQREARIDTGRMTRVARMAIRRLRIREPGALAVTFIDSHRMRALNKRFLHHDRVTDVLSFRYDGESIVGEILIAPAQARAYARVHRLAYLEELARYVVHGILHWIGCEDRTAAEQQKMRTIEDQLLGLAGAHPTGLASRDTSIFRSTRPKAKNRSVPIAAKS